MSDKPSYLESLLQQKAKNNAAIDAKIARAKNKERKHDTRRKILIGAYILNKTKENDTYDQFIRDELDRYLTKKQDRQIFGLPENP